MFESPGIITRSPVLMPGFSSPAAPQAAAIGGDAFVGVVAYGSVDLAGNAAGANFDDSQATTWDSFDVDTNSFKTTNARITIPSAMNGRYGLMHVNMNLTGSGSGRYYCIVRRNGDTGTDYVIDHGWSQSNGNEHIGMTFGPLPLVTNDFYTVGFFIGNPTGYTRLRSSSFGLEVIG